MLDPSAYVLSDLAGYEEVDAQLSANVVRINFVASESLFALGNVYMFLLPLTN